MAIRKMLMRGLAGRLRATRALADDLSARELGSLADIQETYPSQIESDKRKEVGADVIAKLALVLGVTTDYLILGTGKLPTKRQVVAAVEAARAARRVA